MLNQYVAKLHANRIVITRKLNKDTLSGSSCFRYFNGALGRKPKQKDSDIVDFEEVTGKPLTRGEMKQLDKSKERVNRLMFFRDSLTNFEITDKPIVLEMIENELNSEPAKKVMPKVRKLNKKKVVDRALAFSYVKQAQKFLAFYSVSFPTGMSEEDIYSAWNKWLTNCRRYYGLKNYLWVAEKQENGTLHYHMLTTEFMRIQDVNGSMATTLDNMGVFTDAETEYYNRQKKEVAKGRLTAKNYNGCDVVRVFGDKKRVIAYLTKYISKSQIYYKRQPWHCSRSVSALFVAENIDSRKLKSAFENMEDENVCAKVVTNDWAQVVYTNVYSEEKKGFFMLKEKRFFRLIREVNQYIFDLFRDGREITESLLIKVFEHFQNKITDRYNYFKGLVNVLPAELRVVEEIPF